MSHHVPDREQDHEFDRAVAVQRVGDDRWAGTVAEGWDIGGVPNGGYTLALAVAAMRGETAKPDPLAVNAHYLRPTQPGPCTILITMHKPGRTLETVVATLVQDDVARLTATATFADLSAGDGRPQHRTAAPPAIPPLAECAPRVRHTPGATFPPPVVDRLDTRLDPATAAFARGDRIDVAEIAGWVGFADGRPADTLALVFLVDALPPPIFNVGIGPGWVPTIELGVHVRGRPSPGHLRARFATRTVAGGFLEEDGELWDAEGNLVAQSRQLAIPPR